MGVTLHPPPPVKLAPAKSVPAPLVKTTHFCTHRKDWVPRPLHEGLRLSSLEELETDASQGKRQQCPKCGQSRSLYCFTCLLPLTPVPRVDLDFNLWVYVAY